MDINMPKLPFGTLPGHWGLKGTTRDIAQAEYELEGYELKKRLLEIKKPDLKLDDYIKRVLDLELESDKLTRDEYNRKLLDLIKDEKQKALATAELDYREGKIEQLAYEKQVATIQGEPWVSVLRMEFGGSKSLEGSFELDWNDAFVKSLETSGYSGPSPDHVVNQWFMEICKNVALQEFDGTGNFTADAEANFEAMKRWEGPVSPVTDGKKAYK
jgi:hypothetical protein